jgi:hypothetical protein
LDVRNGVHGFGASIDRGAFLPLRNLDLLLLGEDAVARRRPDQHPGDDQQHQSGGEDERGSGHVFASMQMRIILLGSGAPMISKDCATSGLPPISVTIRSISIFSFEVDPCVL